MNIAVLCSGNGTNLQAIIDAVKSGYIPAKIALVVSDNKDAYALTRAKNAGIETLILNKKDFASREEFDKEIVKNLKKKNADLVVSNANYSEGPHWMEPALARVASLLA